uniref:Ycf36 n=1 Tax=Schizymenia dubyi TaxID=38368 RepID=A0A1C9C935_9FLOR|nr:hypothetical protein Schiz_017 [Schizymenia dubyi]AOM64900.1 hypothetical protein Schiz_017 [Schizymenia dubyi]
MPISKKLCPVPFDQQPLNEYSSLKASWFFSWVTLSVQKYGLKILGFSTILFFSFCPLVISILPNNLNILKIIIIDILIVNFVFILIFIRLYLGWSYVVKRLVSATIFYEESGWYDGQIWIKSVESLMQDRLIGLYEVTPFMVRIKYSLYISIILFIFGNILYYLL